MEKAFNELNLLLETFHQALSQKCDPLGEYYEIISLVQRIYELLIATGNNLIIKISPSNIYCLHCYNEIPPKEIDTTIHLSCNPYHCFCSTYCFRRHALLCTDSKLIDLDYIRCPVCLSSIDIFQICDVFDGNLPKIHEEYKEEQIATFKCSICLTVYEIEKGITLDCDHRFCISCIQHYLEININSAQVSNEKLKCPLCPQSISVYTIEYLISPELFAKYEKFRLRDIEIPAESNSFLFYCPGRDCEYICIIDNGVKEFICPLCHFKCCPSCNRDIHNGKTCEEYAKIAKIDAEDKEFKIMMEIKGWARCPVCGIAINKINGCQYVVCTSSKCRGRTYLCYECGQKMEFIHQPHVCKVREELVRAIMQNEPHDDGNIYLGGLLHIKRNVPSPPPPPNPLFQIKPRKNYPWGKNPPQRKREPKPNPHEILPMMIEGKKFT